MILRWVRSWLLCLMLFAQAGNSTRIFPSENKEVLKLRELEEKMYLFWLEQYPEMATHVGEHAYDDMLESFTMETFQKRKAKCDSMLADLAQIDSSQLTTSEYRDLQILKHSLETYVQGYVWKGFGNLNSVSFLGGMMRFTRWAANGEFLTISDFKRYLSRLRALPVQINERLTLLKLAVASNRTAHISSVESTPSIFDFNRNRGNFFQPFRKKPPNIPDKKWEKIISEAKEIVDGVLEKTLNELTTFLLQEYLPATRRTEGVHSWDSGVEYYRACLKWYVGSDITPEFIHEVGLKEVQRIENLIRHNIMDVVGFEGSLQEFMAHVLLIPEFYNHTAEYMLKKYTELIVRKIQPKLFTIFKHVYVPQIRIVQFEHNGPWGSYGDNTFYVNSMETEKRATFNMLPLTLHEVNPGHHFQVAYVSHYNLPRYRETALFGGLHSVPFLIPSYHAYAEGWALYAEFLGEEMGLFTNPYDLYGRYCSEMFRACRLVVDTGIHAFGWSHSKAVEYIRNYTTFPRKQIEMEVDRYITWPGQSVSYKMGEMHIKNLRILAETQLGEKFDLKEFHDQILKHGRVPLDILSDIVNDWIKSYQGERSPNDSVPWKSAKNQSRSIFCCPINFTFVFTFMLSYSAA